MRKPIGLIFFFIYLASVIQLEQLVKLPVLFQHYREHIRMEGKISFLTFLEEHYVQDDPSDADYARDMQLPFKTSHHFFMQVIAAPRPVLEYVNITADIHTQYVNPLNDRRVSNSFPSKIFQPPRLG